MMMPGRKTASANSYRYGMNGQERSGEINSNSYTAEFWQYDSRIGRRFNMDPRPTVGISSYSTYANNPLLYTDVKGDTITLAQEQDRVALLADLNNENAFGRDAFRFNARNQLEFVGNTANYSRQQKKALGFLQGEMSAVYNINVKLSNFTEAERAQFERQSAEIIPGFTRENGSYSEQISQGARLIQANVFIDRTNITPVVKTEAVTKFVWRKRDGTLGESDTEPDRKDLDIEVGGQVIRQKSYRVVFRKVDERNVAVTIPNTLLTIFFHEVSHSANENVRGGQGKVISNENLIRKVLDIPLRPTEDPMHNREEQ